MISTQNTDQMDRKFNLLDLGRDAWDDTEIIQAFDENMNEYMIDHSKQMENINVTTKIPSMTDMFGLNQHIEIVKKNLIESKEIDDSNNKYGNVKDKKGESSNNSSNGSQNSSDASSNDDSDEDDDDENEHQNNNNNNKNRNNKNRNNKNRRNDELENRLEPSFMPFDEKYEWKTVDDENAMNPQNVVYSFENMGMGGNLINTMDNDENNDNENSQQNRKSKKSKKRKKNKNRKNGNEYNQNEYYGGQQQQFDNTYQSQNPNANMYQNPPNMQIPDIFRQGLNLLPPTNDQSPNKSQALSNMLLAWYWTGYYAGYEAATSNENRN